MRRADRLFHLVQLLRNRGFRTAAQLATEMQVSVRTVYRDVRDLVATGVPIEGEPGVGYRLGRGYELPPMTFNALEIEALVLGARMVQAWSDDELAGAARAAVAKVEAVLPTPLRDVLVRTALFAPTRHWAGVVTSDLSRLRHAISERRKLHLAYTRADGSKSARVVRPLGLYFWGDRWSLAAFCELRQAYRNFRPDRIQALKPLDETFDGLDGIHLEGFIRQMERD
ncbi:MAG: YafY family protein [Myxococcales bacterium]|nr:YafY family protein [Myxococcales bacterium]